MSSKFGTESEGYKLKIGGYSGNAGDSLSYHKWLQIHNQGS